MGELLIDDLEHIFMDRKGRLVDGQYDITLGFAIPFSRGDWYLESARYVIDENDNTGMVSLVFGLRDCILVNDTTVIDLSKYSFVLCNLFGIVPLISLIASKHPRNLQMAVLETRSSGTYVKLVFQAATTKKENWARTLAQSVIRFMNKWEEFSKILERILNNDPYVGYWHLDWRDFLGEVSNFETGPRYPHLDDGERCLALQTVKNAAKGLIYSVLSRDEIETPLVQELLYWLDELSIETHSSKCTSSPVEAI